MNCIYTPSSCTLVRLTAKGFFLIVAAFCLIVTVPTAAASRDNVVDASQDLDSSRSRPNVIVIFADDLYQFVTEATRMR